MEKKPRVFGLLSPCSEYKFKLKRILFAEPVQRDGVAARNKLLLRARKEHPVTKCKSQKGKSPHHLSGFAPPSNDSQ
jgi:hypothetical protein